MRRILNWWLSIDYITFVLLLMLMAIGLLLITAASPAMADRIGTSSFYFINKQIQFVIIALPCLILPSLMGEKALRTFSLISFILVVLLLCLLPFYGDTTKGAKRWMTIVGFSLQPSEFLKPFYGVLIAKILTNSNTTYGLGIEHDAFHKINKVHSNKSNQSNKRFVIASLLHLFVMTLLLIQPDFGMAITVSVITGIQFFVVGLPMHFIFIMIIILTVSLFFAYYFLPHVTKRIDVFFDSNAENCYQVHKSLESYAKGGLWGTGPGEGALKYMLPDSHTDFIFAIAGEELGILFCLIIIGLLAFMILRCIVQISNLQNQYNICLAINAIAYISFQSLFNIGVTLHIFPTKGMTLPFISYGGSSLLALSIAMGIYLQATRKRLVYHRNHQNIIIYSKKISNSQVM